MRSSRLLLVAAMATGAVAHTEPCTVEKLTCSTGTVASGAGVIVCEAPAGVESVVVLSRSSPAGAWVEAPMVRSGCRFAGRLPKTAELYASARDGAGAVVAELVPRPGGVDAAPAAPAAPLVCGVDLYAEPTVLYAIGLDSVVARVGGGFHVHDCTSRRLHVRLGITGYVAQGSGGVGAEVEVGMRAAPELVLGLRASAETGSLGGADFSTGASRYLVGARLRTGGSVVLAVDAFHQTEGTLFGHPSVTGAMFGLGLEGRPGGYTVATGAGLTLIGLALAFAALSGSH
jgi:hypothetical protein